MRTRNFVRRCVRLSVLGLLVGPLSACGLKNATAPPNQIGGAVEQQFDTRAADVDGDGDRSLLSGHNDLNNPPVDLRSLTRAHPGSPLVMAGRYAGNSYADQVAQLTLSVPTVTYAAAVASGRVMLIGLGLRRNQPVSLDWIQREVRRRVLTRAPDFRYVYVTAQPRQVTEIVQIGDGLRNGQPMSMFTHRIHAIMRTLRPVPYNPPG